MAHTLRHRAPLVGALTATLVGALAASAPARAGAATGAAHRTRTGSTATATAGTGSARVRAHHGPATTQRSRRAVPNGQSGAGTSAGPATSGTRGPTATGGGSTTTGGGSTTSGGGGSTTTGGGSTTSGGGAATTRGTGARLVRHAGGLVLSVRHRGRLLSGLAHAAASIGDSIVDFSFSPGTITIHAGDTVTWTNVGKQPHTATATDHSWTTSLLKPGQSGSHTFTAPGTYTYFCIVHPWMKGTVVVLANTTTPSSTHQSTPSTPTGTTRSTPSAAATQANNPNDLPMTGIDLGALLLCGAGLSGLGVVLRRRLRDTR